MINTKWVLCPYCGKKTKIKVQADTILQNFLLFCPWCKKEFLIDLKRFEIILVQEVDK